MNYNKIKTEYDKKHLKEWNIKKFQVMQDENNLVWTDNDLALGLVQPFSARQLKIIDYAIGQVDAQQIKEKKQDYVEIKLRDMLRFLNLDYSGQMIKELERDIIKIRNVGGWWNYDINDPRKKTTFAFFESADELVDEKKTTYKVRFNHHFLEGLFNTEPVIRVNQKTGKVEKIGFNFYASWNTKKLKSKYSILLFKKCNVWKNSPAGYFVYEVKDIKQDFLMLDKSFGYISSHCIIPAMREINEETDIHISKIEYKPNKKKVERLLIYCHQKKDEKIERKAEDLSEGNDEYLNKEKEQYFDKLSNLKTKTDERKAEKRHNIIAERKDLTAFEDKLKYNPDNQDINEIIKEREEKLNKELKQENIDKFISVSETIKYNKAQHQAKKEYYKGKGIDYIKFLKALKEEEKEEKYWEKLSYKEKVEINKINKRANMFMAFIGKNNLQEKYNEEFLQNVMQESNLSREEATEFIEEIEKEIDENTIKIMRETIEKYDKKHNVEKNEENKDNGETNN